MAKKNNFTEKSIYLQINKKSMRNSRTKKQKSRGKKKSSTKASVRAKSKFWMAGTTRRQKTLQKQREFNTKAIATSIHRKLPSIKYISPSSTKLINFPVYPLDRSLVDRYEHHADLLKSSENVEDLLWRVDDQKKQLRKEQKTGTTSLDNVKSRRSSIKKLRSRLHSEVRKTNRAIASLSKIKTSSKNSFLTLRKPGIITGSKIRLDDKIVSKWVTNEKSKKGGGIKINIRKEPYQLLNLKFIEYIYRDICEILEDYVLFMVYIDKNNELTVIQLSTMEGTKQSRSFKQKELKLNKPFSCFLLGFLFFIHPENKNAETYYGNQPNLTDSTFTSAQSAFDYYLANGKTFHGAGHANLILIDNEHKTIERFDPLGIDLKADEEDIKGLFGTFDVPLESAIKGVFSNIQDYRYVSTLEYCPQVSFQKLQPRFSTKLNSDLGYCSWWSMFFLEMRLLNRNMSTDVLVENMFADFQSVGGEEKMSVYMSLTILLYVFGAFMVIQELSKKRTNTINDMVLEKVYRKLYGDQGRMDYSVDILDGRNKIYNLKKLISEIDDEELLEHVPGKTLRF